MPFAREIRRLLAASLAAFALIGIAAAYWAVSGASTLLLREDNPRVVEAQRRIERGRIFGRNGILLADSVAADGAFTRNYPHPASYSAVGYFSLRYGSSGAEAAFDAALSGEREIATISDYLRAHTLRPPQVGADIRLSLDAAVQEALVAAMGALPGAGLVMDATSGALLALASQPTFNPNTLDDDWARLAADAGEPFFHRALQGNYQLGGAAYLLLLAQAIGSGFDLSQQFAGASAAVDLGGGTTVACIQEAPSDRLTLPQAFIAGCPAPFLLYWQQNLAGTQAHIKAEFDFEQPLSLAGFPAPEALAAPASDAVDARQQALRNALGQGALRTTPLQLMTVLSAIAADGSAAAPNILAAQRPPAAESWLAHAPPTARARMFSPAVAEALRHQLSESWSALSARAAPEAAIGATLYRSQAGDALQTWLLGFIRWHDDSRAIAFLLLQEARVGAAALIAQSQPLFDALLALPG